MAKFKLLLDSNFNQTVENPEKWSETKVAQKSNRKLNLESYTSSADSRNIQILAYFSKIIQIFEKLFRDKMSTSATSTTSTTSSTSTTQLMNNPVAMITDQSDRNQSKSNNLGSLDLLVNDNPVVPSSSEVKENSSEQNPRKSRNLDIENEFSIFALFQSKTNFNNNLDLSDLDDSNLDYEEVYKSDDESNDEPLPKSFGTDISTSFTALFRQWNNPESGDKSKSTTEQAESLENTNLTSEQVQSFDKTNLSSGPVSFSNFFRNIPDTLLDESMKTQLQNLTENAGDYLSRWPIQP